MGRNDGPTLDTEVSFVPMAAVDERDGAIAERQSRPYREVMKGYTPFREGDVLLAKITPCMENGKATIATELANGLGFGSTEFHVLRPGPRVLSKWIFYFIRRQEFRMAAKASFTGTAGQQRVPVQFLQSIRIPVPPLSDQQRSVEILDAAEDLRKLRAESGRRTADLVPALVHTYFGELGDTRFPRHPLGNVAQVVSGVTKGRRLVGRATVEVPYLRVANVQDGRLDLSELKTIEALPEEVRTLSLEKGDVLLTEGGDFDKLGRGAIWDHDIPNCIHQNHVFRVRVNRTKIIPLFFANLLITPYAKTYFLRCAKRTTNLASVNMTQLRAFPIPIPPMTLQRQFAERVAEISTLKEMQSESRLRLDGFFQSVLHRAFIG